MSLTDMAWLTQGPMAAADLELDVDSMEQEAEAYWLTSVPGYEPLDNPSLGTMGVVTVGIGQSVRSKSKNEDGNLIFRMECDEQLVDESTPTFKGNIAQEPRTFGAIKVYSSILGTADEAKSFVVTNQTTSRDLISIILASYHVIYEDQILFCLVLERSNKRFGLSGKQRVIKIQDNAKPLDLQSRYNRGDTKFCLQLNPGVGVVTVQDNCFNSELRTSSKHSRRVFITEKTTCRELITQVMRAHDVTDPADDFSLYEVDSNSKAAHELCLDHKPLIIQQQWLDPYEYYFEVRHKTPLRDRKMRRHSIDSVEELKPQVRKVLNIKAARKSLIPRIKKGPSTKGNSEPSQKSQEKEEASKANTLENGIANSTQSGDRETTMAKLKDSLSKLREHLDTLQKRKTMSYDTGSESDAINQPHGDGPRNSDSSDEGHPVQNLKAEVMSKRAQNGGYETGDTSLNESDAGSTCTSMRGNNDSAYASDRMSHNSVTSQGGTSHQRTLLQTNAPNATATAVTRRRTRRSSYTSSDQSSPENPEGQRGNVQLRKTQSLYELQRSQAAEQGQPVQVGIKPGRIRSASHAQAKSRIIKKNTALSGSDEQINTWARRKQYDFRRRVNTVNIECVKRSQSFQDIKPMAVARGRPTSAGHDRFAPQLGATAIIKAGVKMRRTLPKVPVGAEKDIEERKKRMSAEIIRRARVSVDGDILTGSSLVLKRREDFKDPNVQDYSGSQTSLDDNSRLPVIHCGSDTNLANDDIGKRPELLSEEPYKGQYVQAPHPQQGTVIKPKPRYGNETGNKSGMVNGFNSHDSEFSDGSEGQDAETDPQNSVRARHGSNGESSQEALQRIINDLRNAATKSYEGSASSRPDSRTSDSSITQEYQKEAVTDNDDQSDVQYSQLARWGVLEPTKDDIATHFNHQYQQQDSNDEEDDQLTDNPQESYYNSSTALSKSSRTSRTNGSMSSYSDHSDLRVEHPTIHRVLKSCDLVRATIERCDIFTEFGFEMFESTFYDVEGKERSKRPVFRTPSGRKPVLGRRKGAFVPVAPVSQNSQDAGPILSLCAVDNVIDNSPADKCGTIQEGDFIIEVNGLYVVDADMERVQAEIADAGNILDLVLARSHELVVDRMEDDSEVPAEVRKELERLKLKYDAMRQDAERSQDIIADLKLDVKDRDRQIGQLESDLRMKEDHIDQMETTFRKKDEEVAEWKYEANHRNVELARLKYENKQKEDRIAQLRRLLIQQTELMQMHQGRSTNGTDIEDFEEHVSAV